MTGAPLIAVDTAGADAGAEVVAEGARRSGARVLLFGPAASLGAGDDVVDAPTAISNEEDPIRAVRSRPDASVVQAARAVAEGRAQALVSAGSTGAALAASVLHIGRLRGVHRPAVAALLPVPGRPVLLLDAGASVEVRPEHLVQFAYMGSMLMEALHGVARPRVGLLSVGEEPGKGTPDVVEAGARLRDGPLDFAGNVEGWDLTGGGLDVVVTDGFTGNVALKVAEGTVRTVMGAVRDTVRSGPVASVGGLLIRGRMRALRHTLDKDAAGGAYLLGLKEIVVVTHGGSTAEGIAGSVRMAERGVRERTVERTADLLAEAGALRSVPAASVARP